MEVKVRSSGARQQLVFFSQLMLVIFNYSYTFPLIKTLSLFVTHSDLQAEKKKHRRFINTVVNQASSHIFVFIFIEMLYEGGNSFNTFMRLQGNTVSECKQFVCYRCVQLRTTTSRMTERARNNFLFLLAAT